MLQQISVTQIQRKKILTRSDLICELEQILLDLVERPHFASLRTLSLDSFCEMDNPYLKQVTLADLAANPKEVLRDSTIVDKKEIAALVEAIFLVNVRSDHSVGLLRQSFSNIERRADSVQDALKDVLAAVPKQKGSQIKATPEDSNVAKLRVALGELVKSPHYASTKNLTIENFWDKNASSCSALAKMSWQELIETAPSAIFNLPNFGKSRLKYLLKSIELAKTGLAANDTEQNESNTNSKDILKTSETEILNAIEEIAEKSSAATGNLAEVLRQTNSPALLTAYLCQSTIQRRVGHLLGVTESRISQLLLEAFTNLAENTAELAPNILEKLEFRLLSPSCSEPTLLKLVGLENLSLPAMELVNLVVKSLGATHPTFKGRALKGHWTKRSNKFQSIVVNVLNDLPLSTKNLSARLEEALVGSSAPEILSVLPPTAYFLRKRDFWYKDQEQALIEVLKAAKEPMTAQDITALFETGPRQMRYLLQNSKHIMRIGRNNGRRYTITEQKEEQQTQKD